MAPLIAQRPIAGVSAGVLVACVVGLAALAALLAGAAVFGIVVVVLAAAVLLDLAELVARGAARPILPAAALPAAVLPATIVASPAGGFDRVSPVVAAGLLVAFVLVLVTGRRAGVAAALGSTLLTGLVVGLGASCLVLLRALPDGDGWLLGLGVLMAAAGVARGLAVRAGAAPAAAAAAVVTAVAAVGAGTVLTLDPPYSPATAFAMAAAAAAATLGAVAFRVALSNPPSTSAGVAGPAVVAGGREAAPQGGQEAARGAGQLVAAVDGVLLAAPVAYLIVRSGVA